MWYLQCHYKQSERSLWCLCCLCRQPSPVSNQTILHPRPPHLQHYRNPQRTVFICVYIPHPVAMCISPSFPLHVCVCVCVYASIFFAAGVYDRVWGLLRCIGWHSCYHTKAPNCVSRSDIDPSWDAQKCTLNTKNTHHTDTRVFSFHRRGKKICVCVRPPAPVFVSVYVCVSPNLTLPSELDSLILTEGCRKVLYRALVGFGLCRWCKPDMDLLMENLVILCSLSPQPESSKHNGLETVQPNRAKLVSCWC